MPGLRGDQLALYLQDMYAATREAAMEVPTKFDKIFMVKTGLRGAGWKETQILGAGEVRRHTAEGEDIRFKSPIEGHQYFVKYHTFSDGITLTKEAVEDTVKLGNLLRDLAQTWGRSVRVTKESWAARVFNDGGTLSGNTVFNGTHTGNSDPSGDLIYDNKPLFNLTGNARSTKGGATYFNSIAGLTLTPANFETVYNLATATNNRDERDRVISNPVNTLLVRPGQDRFQAERIVDTSRGFPGGDLNDMNPFFKIVSVIDWDYLTDSAFYIGWRQHPAFQFHQRQLPEIRFFRDEENLGYKASINLRCGILIKDWRVWARGGGSSNP